MNREYGVFVLLVIGSIVLLVTFVRRNRVREGLFAFLAAQLITWPGTIFMNYFGFIESPVRIFPNATDSNFMISFVFLPTVFVIYYLQYPKEKSRILQVTYSLAFGVGASLVHVAIQKYTDLLKYITFSGFLGCIQFMAGNYVLRRYVDWFFCQLLKIQEGESR